MLRRPTGHGHIYAKSGAWQCRFYIVVRGVQVQKSLRICSIDADHAEKNDPSVVQLATELVKKAQAEAALKEETRNKGKCPTCGRFTKGARKQ